MEAKFTPGPWSAMVIEKNNMDRGTAMVATTYRDGMAIDCFDSGKSFAESAANARLIAASPDLFKAAKRALTVLRATGQSAQRGNVLEALESAIAKATGEAA